MKCSDLKSVFVPLDVENPSLFPWISQFWDSRTWLRAHVWCWRWWMAHQRPRGEAEGNFMGPLVVCPRISHILNVEPLFTIRTIAKLLSWFIATVSLGHWDLWM